LNWAAPEILKEEPEWSEKAGIFLPSLVAKNILFTQDIYSLGMVFYEIISREIPFKSDTNLFVLHKKIKNGILPTIPKDCPVVHLFSANVISFNHITGICRYYSKVLAQ
jgi:serine/threonine protein kinase